MTPGRQLKPEYQEAADQWQAHFSDDSCRCFIAPPCSSCVHPGNPSNLECNEDAWESADPFLDLLVDLALERLAAALEADVNVHLHQLKDHSNEYDSTHFPER